jgi:site-specific recombinase XerD
LIINSKLYGSKPGQLANVGQMVATAGAKPQDLLALIFHVRVCPCPQNSASNTTGRRFADASREWLRYVEQERGRKASTVADYRSAVRAHLDPAFGALALEDVTSELVERWLADALSRGEVSRRSLQKLVVLLNGIFGRARRVWRVSTNPVADVEHLSVVRRAAIDFYAPEEVHALARAAESERTSRST